MIHCKQKVEIDNKSFKHTSTGIIIDSRDDGYGLSEYLVKFDDGSAHWFYNHEFNRISN